MMPACPTHTPRPLSQRHRDLHRIQSCATLKRPLLSSQLARSTGASPWPATPTKEIIRIPLPHNFPPCPSSAPAHITYQTSYVTPKAHKPHVSYPSKHPIRATSRVRKGSTKVVRQTHLPAPLRTDPPGALRGPLRGASVSVLLHLLLFHDDPPGALRGPLRGAFR